MVLGRVKGSVWATKKDERLNGQKLMVVETKHRLIIATDNIGAGIGDDVIICFGSSARKGDMPIDATIIGIVDELKSE